MLTITFLSSPSLSLLNFYTVFFNLIECLATFKKGILRWLENHNLILKIQVFKSHLRIHLILRNFVIYYNKFIMPTCIV